MVWNMQKLEYSKNKNLVYDIYGIIFLLYVSKVLWNKGKEINIKDILDDFIENMPESIKKNIRCVYGVENAKIGIFGTDYRSSYMVLLNDYYKKILEINKLKNGEIKKI